MLLRNPLKGSKSIEPARPFGNKQQSLMSVCVTKNTTKNINLRKHLRKRLIVASTCDHNGIVHFLRANFLLRFFSCIKRFRNQNAKISPWQTKFQSHKMHSSEHVRNGFGSALFESLGIQTNSSETSRAFLVFIFARPEMVLKPFFVVVFVPTLRNWFPYRNWLAIDKTIPRSKQLFCVSSLPTLQKRMH